MKEKKGGAEGRGPAPRAASDTTPSFSSPWGLGPGPLHSQDLGLPTAVDNRPVGDPPTIMYNPATPTPVAVTDYIDIPDPETTQELGGAAVGNVSMPGTAAAATTAALVINGCVIGTDDVEGRVSIRDICEAAKTTGMKRLSYFYLS